jgi:hypothetical protein
MGKFNEYSQKATPEDADSLMIYDAATKANKLLSFSGIWNWIVGKLTNAVISNLQTNNKSVVGALNELNSKAVSTYDMGSYYNDYTFAKFLQEKQGTGITILSGYTGYLFSDLPTDLSDAVNVITYKGNNQKSGIYSQGFISDSLGHRYTFVADASFSNVTFNKF